VVVFDYPVAPQLLSSRERAGRDRLMARTEAGGEPWRSAFDPPVLAAALRGLGYARLEDLDGAELTARYLSHRADGLRKSNVTRILVATM
jgi:O-methyltransferase involved in polyketide biosynthesis